ncbi:MAG: phosphoesterase, partial [Caulobacter sp.]
MPMISCKTRQGLLGAAVVMALWADVMTTTAFAHPGHAVQPVAPAHRKSPPVKASERRWLAGDHHVHSWFSVSLKPGADPSQPPILVKAGDAVNPITVNARMAARHGLAWMVATDHGGPNHSKLNRDEAYPELLRARVETPSVLQFWGMELDTPAAEHSSVILPHSAGERDALFGIESRYNRREPWPADPARNQEAFMLEALRHMKALADPPIVIANHPSRSATGVGQYGLVSPAELRNWNDTAPDVAVGMEGAPGHQASSLKPDGSPKPQGDRGGYGRAPTMGGFDQMTAKLGGFWDSMLGE